MSQATDGNRRNHLAWIAPLIVFGGMVSYFLVFSRWAALRDFPWVNLPLVLGGVALSIVAWGKRKRGSKLSVFFAASGLVFSVLIAALFCTYVFYLSSTLPQAQAATMEMERAPGFALTDQHGDIVQLADLRGKKVVLVFFRGFW